MSDVLTTYLHDHLAGSHFALELLDSLSDEYADEPLGAFARDLHAEIKQDQAVLESVASQLGEQAQFNLKDAAGWLAEKLSRFKLKRDGSGAELGTFEALETLTLGIQGKAALWRVLSMISSGEPRLPVQNYNALEQRAEDQYRRVEEQRLALAKTTFTASPAARS